MMGMRRSLLVSYSQRYALALINVASTALLSRLLMPSEMGVAMVGIALFSLTDAFRDFGVGNYLIQAREITLESVRTAFTVTLVLSAILSTTLFTFSREIAGYYQEAGLARVLQLLSVMLVLLPFSATGTAMLRRDMAFMALARINLLTTFVYSVVVNGLAAIGFGYMSVAWASLSSVFVATLFTVVYRGEYKIYWISIHSWRQVVGFGSFSGGSSLLNLMSSNLPQLMLGRILGFSAVGLYNRSTMMSQLFDRLVLDGMSPVLLPALSEKARAGADLKQPYLRALEYLSALQWPFLLCLGLLADPAVKLLLGHQWTDAAPIVRIMAFASMWLFPTFLTYPLLVAIGRVRDTFSVSLITVPASLGLMFVASFFGLKAVAASLFATAPFQLYVAVWFIRRRIHFTWWEFAAATRKSGIIAVSAAIAPAAAVALNGLRFDLSIPAMMAAALGAILGWLVALFATGHPLFGEMREAAAAGVQRAIFRRRSQRRDFSIPAQRPCSTVLD
jgi:O-antigen/teichoic acid export membrane protein